MDKKSFHFGHPVRMGRKKLRSLFSKKPLGFLLCAAPFTTLYAQDWSTLQNESEKFKDNYRNIALTGIDIIVFTAGIVAILTLINLIKWKQGGENIGSEFGGWAMKVLLFSGGYGLIRILFGLSN